MMKWALVATLFATCITDASAGTGQVEGYMWSQNEYDDELIPTNQQDRKGDLWYPDQFFQIREYVNDADATGLECSVSPFAEGEITIDDIEDGLLCTVNHETGDICMPQHYMDILDLPTAITAARTEKYDPATRTGNMLALSEKIALQWNALKTEVIDNGVKDAEGNLVEGITAGVVDSTGFALANIEFVDFASVRIDGRDFRYLKNGYSKVTGVNLRGLRTICGRDIEGDTTMVELFKEFGSYEIEAAPGNMRIAHLDNALYIDLTNLDWAGNSLQLRNMPDVQIVSLDSLQGVSYLTINNLPTIRSVYMPELITTFVIEVRHNINLLDFVAPKMAGLDDPNGDPDGMTIDGSETPNLHMFVVGCMADMNFVGATGTDPLDYDNVDTDYLSRNVDGHYQNTDGDIVKRNTFLVERDPTDHASWKWLRTGSLQTGVGAWATPGDIAGGPTANGAIRQGSYKDGDGDGPGDVPTPRGYIEWCPGFRHGGSKEKIPEGAIFPYDHIHDGFAGSNSANLNMNIRCDTNRDEDTLAQGMNAVAVVEVQHAVPNKHVNFAWSRKEGTADWKISKNCEVETNLASIDVKERTLARRADENGYVKIRHFVEECGNFYYTAVSGQRSEGGCKVAKMANGQDIYTDAGTEHGGKAKLNLRKDPKHEGTRKERKAGVVVEGNVWPLEDLSAAEGRTFGEDEFWGDDPDVVEGVQVGPGVGENREDYAAYKDPVISA